MSRAPNWDFGTGFHEPARGYHPAMPSAQDQSHGLQARYPFEHNTDRLQRPFGTDILPQDKVGPEFRKTASQKIVVPPPYLRQRAYQSPTGDLRGIDPPSPLYFNQRRYPVPTPSQSPQHFSPTSPVAYLTDPSYAGQNFSQPASGIPNFSRQVTPQVQSSQISSPGTSIWSPVYSRERQFHQIGSSTGVPTESLAVQDRSQYAPFPQTGYGVSEKPSIPPYSQDAFPFVSQSYAPVSNLLSDKAGGQLIPPKNNSLASNQPRKLAHLIPPSASNSQRSARSAERLFQGSLDVQATPYRSNSPYERPSPPSPNRGLHRYKKPKKGFGQLTRKASKALTAFSGSKARQLSESLKQAFKRGRDNQLDSPAFEQWDEDSTVVEHKLQANSSEVYTALATPERLPPLHQQFPAYPSDCDTLEYSETRDKGTVQEHLSGRETPERRHPSESLAEQAQAKRTPEQRITEHHHIEAVQVPQPAETFPPTTPQVSLPKTAGSPTLIDLYNTSQYKDYPSGQLPPGASRLEGRLETYKILFGRPPTDSTYLGGSEASSESGEIIKGHRRSVYSGVRRSVGSSSARPISYRHDNPRRTPSKGSPRRFPPLRRQNAFVRRCREATPTKKQVDLGVVAEDPPCGKFLKNESGKPTRTISTISGFEPRRITPKASPVELPAAEFPRQAAVLPITSRKVSDLRAKFEHPFENASNSCIKKAFPDSQSGKKKSNSKNISERSIVPKDTWGEQGTESSPKVFVEQITKLPYPPKHPLAPLGAARLVAAQKSLNKKVVEGFDQADKVEANSWPHVEDEEQSSLPPPPIPRKSSKRVVRSSEKQKQKEGLSDSENVLKAIIPSEFGVVTLQPVTPENNSSASYINSLNYYSDSVYSEDENQENFQGTSLKAHQDIKKYHTPPEKYPDLLVPPLSIRKIDHGSRQESSSPSITPFSLEDPFSTENSFLGCCLTVEEHLAQMATLQVDSANISSTKTKAVEDARAMQQAVIESCKKIGRDPPKYVLLELIGKGSFGRVYKGKDVGSGHIVAVKIIDIDESDTLNPRLADTYSEFMKEVNALKILSESKARNINLVIEALPVGKAMWMITEYCGGGSIATLMKPTPTGLKEKFITPILREVAEAVKWVHQAGIIHRDLKCANVLITEDGGVQLCDFGVAGIIEGAVDKRSTFIGTPNWMAPELFQGSSYGKEVDIWAFGSMAYEMATGLPPNAKSGLTGMDLGPYLKNHIPRLEGGTYSEGLRSIIACCLEMNPSDRPTIEAVQKHSYIYNTSTKYPATSLSDLVRAFKMWESHGGTRKSLFMAGGAQAHAGLSSTALSDDNWNFSTTAAFDQAVAQDTSARDVINVYGPSVTLDADFSEDTSRPNRIQETRATRRRPPPEALAPLKGPLEKLFDPNTISTYEENSRSHYNQHQNSLPDVPSIDVLLIQPREVSDLPLRDVTNQTSIRDTLIDLDAYDVPSGLSSFTGMDTIRPMRKDSNEGAGEYDSSGYHDFNRPALSDPLDNPNRRTQDWKFPVMAPPASAAPDLTRFPATLELQRPAVTPASGARPALVHHPTEPISLPTHSSNSLLPSAPGSPNRMSLIDLDLSLPEPSRPSTADSTMSQEMTSANPFHLERHASLYHPSAREPSLYISEDPSVMLSLPTGNTLQDLVDQSDLSASDAEGPHYDHYNGIDVLSYEARSSIQPDYDSSTTGRPSDVTSGSSRPGHNQPYTMAHFPDLPPPPSVAALSGNATHTEMIEEMHRMLGGLTSQLDSFKDVYDTLPRGTSARELSLKMSKT